MYLVIEPNQWLPFPRPCFMCGGGLDVLCVRDEEYQLTRLWQSRCRHCGHAMLVSIIRPPELPLIDPD